MRLRIPWMLCTATLVAAGSAAAQDPPATGSLTVLSRPSGATFRLTGEQVVVGRTPMVIDRGLTGRYEVRSLDPGYGTWRRTLILSGTTADTVWMTLHPRGAAGAGMRSLLVPGWGQFHDRHPGRGVLFFIASAGVGAAFAVTAARYQDRLDAYRDADLRYQTATTVTSVEDAFQARQRAADRAEDAYKVRQIAFGAFCGVWGLNVLEAMLHSPSPPSEGLGFSILPPDPASGSGPMATLTMRF